MPDPRTARIATGAPERAPDPNPNPGAPYWDPSLSPEDRAADLLPRLSLEDKVGLMFHTVIEMGPDGELLDGPGAIAKSATRTVVVDKRMTHFNVHGIPDAESAARWSNRIQTLARSTGCGVPVTISSDPRHGSAQNAGTSWAASFLSQWPEPLGLGAIGDAELVRAFADTVRREYSALGIRAALHPTADLATEPRWGRQRECFGSDPVLVSDMVSAYLEGLSGRFAGASANGESPKAVAATTKHFPGAGPQKDGEDGHFPYGAEQVYPAGRFEDHLEPFRRAIEAGTAAIMPYYGKPMDLMIDGREIEAVGFGYNRQILTGLLREELGYDGVIVSDWELVNDNHVGDQVLPARAWGVEHLDPAGRMEKILDAGADQFGGEECTDLLLALVHDGRVTEDRIDVSARRLLIEKFRLGLFDDPFVDEHAAHAEAGRPEDRAAGLEAQSRSTVILHDDAGLLPLQADPDRKIYVEGIDADGPDRDRLTRLGAVVEDPADADLAIVRIAAPFEPRDDLFLEAWFHQGSLEFRPGLVVRLARIAEHCPLMLDVDLDRAAILTPLVPIASTLLGTFGISSRAFLDAVTGAVPPEGRLPIELPRSMQAVRDSREDEAGTSDPLYQRGHGLRLPRTRPSR